MGNILIRYQKARDALRLGPYERWQAECITGLLQRHDERVAKERRLMLGRRKSVVMRARQDAGRRVSSIPPFGWTIDPDRPWRLVRHPGEQRVCRRIVQEAATGKSLRAIARSLESAEVICRNSCTWSHQTIAAVIQRAHRNVVGRCEDRRL